MENKKSQKELEQLAMKLEDERNGVVFNNGECGKTCNCVEVHQFHEGEESLKRGYQCLKPQDSNALKKLEPVQPTPSEKEQLRKKFDVKWNEKLKSTASFSNMADSVFDFFYSEIEERKEISTQLGNLLAILHRDGGHHQQKVGLLAAITDAIDLLHRDWVLNENQIAS